MNTISYSDLPDAILLELERQIKLKKLIADGERKSNKIPALDLIQIELEDRGLRFL